MMASHARCQGPGDFGFRCSSKRTILVATVPTVAIARQCQLQRFHRDGMRAFRVEHLKRVARLVSALPPSDSTRALRSLPPYRVSQARSLDPPRMPRRKCNRA